MSFMLSHTLPPTRQAPKQGMSEAASDMQKRQCVCHKRAELISIPVGMGNPQVKKSLCWGRKTQVQVPLVSRHSSYLGIGKSFIRCHSLLHQPETGAFVRAEKASF